jgi:hypothetical protein
MIFESAEYSSEVQQRIPCCSPCSCSPRRRSAVRVSAELTSLYTFIVIAI